MKVNVERLKALRHVRGMSQEELADQSGVGRATISRIERGLSGAQGRTLRRLAVAFGVNVEELVRIESSFVEELGGFDQLGWLDAEDGK